MTGDQELTYDSDRLIREWRERYTDRRTVAREMLDQAEVLVRDAIACELQHKARAERQEHDWDLERREARVAQAERWHEQEVDRLRRQIAEQKVKIDSLSPRQTLMREERETVEDGTIVRIQAPTVPSYGDNTSPRPWMLGELEDVAQRLRMAGGDERTEVRFKRDAIESCVPFPEFALTPARLTAVAETPAAAVAVRARAVPRWAWAGAAVVALLVVLLTVIL